MTTIPQAPTLGAFDDDELVTGEAVALSLPVAGLAARVGSALVDAMLTLVALSILTGMTALAVGGADDAVQAGVMLIVLVGVVVGYPTTMETVGRGRTVGMLAAGVRVVRDDGGPIGFRHALARALVGFVEKWMLFGMPAVLCALLSPRGKRFGDLAAGTYVVRERLGLRMQPPAGMPHFLVPWASSADIAPLPDALALATRQFLSRVLSLTPAARESIGRELYGELLAYVSPPPPPGVHPEYVMAAIIAERGRRDARTIARRDAAVARALPPDPLAPSRPWVAPQQVVPGVWPAQPLPPQAATPQPGHHPGPPPTR